MAYNPPPWENFDGSFSFPSWSEYQDYNNGGFDFNKLLGTIGNVGSALTPFAGIASGIAGIFGQSAANKAMLKATRETNAMNYQMWQEQQTHNKDMFAMENEANVNLWRMQQEYNDPSAQIERLRKAGLNPYLAMSSGNASGVASSAPASARATPANAPTYQAPPTEAFQSPAVKGLQEAYMAMASMAQTSSTIAQQSSANTLLPLQKDLLSTQYSKSEKDVENVGLQNLLFGKELAVKDQFNDLALTQGHLMNQNLMAQIALTSLQGEYQEMFNFFFSEDMQKTIALKIANIELLEEQKILTHEEAETEKAKYADYLASTALKQWQIEDTKQGIRESQARVRNLDANTNQVNAVTRGINLQNSITSDSYDFLVGNNAATFLNNYADYDIKTLSYKLQKGVFPAMQFGIKAKYRFDEMYYKNQYNVQKNIFDSTNPNGSPINNMFLNLKGFQDYYDIHIPFTGSSNHK